MRVVGLDQSDPLSNLASAIDNRLTRAIDASVSVQVVLPLPAVGVATLRPRSGGPFGVRSVGRPVLLRSVPDPPALVLALPHSRFAFATRS